MKSLIIILSLCVGGLFIHAVDHQEPSADEVAVKAAVTDYVEGLYLVDSNRIKNSVHPSLHKIGYYYSEDKGKYGGPYPMSFRQLVDLAATWNADGKHASASSPKEIVLLDVLDKTASAKLTAEWGIDYFHLAKEDGKWFIMNVLWQSHPLEN